ncbi:unnamed protein product [Peniophora sp. CBMAI 1063]|nr:unnamed protein product [Peniophora sp. CBMAI 1063]
MSLYLRSPPSYDESEAVARGAELLTRAFSSLLMHGDAHRSQEDQRTALSGAQDTPLDNVTPSPQLPADVICILYDILWETDKPSRGHLGWIRLTHVNRLWRSVGVDWPRLWTRDYGTLASHDASSAFRVRARGLPLTVSIPHPPQGRHEDVLIHAVSNGIRTIETLNLKSRSYMWSSLIAGKRLPEMHVLDIDDSASRVGAVYKLHPTVHAPKLTHATLVGCRPFLLVAPSLVSLTLTGLILSVDRALDILRGTPRLEHLQIDEPMEILVSMNLDEPDAKLKGPVDLPHLHTVRIRPIANLPRRIYRRAGKTFLGRIIMPSDVKDVASSMVA